MILFAKVALVPDSILVWAMVGFLAGLFAGVVMKPGRYGVVGDTAVALAGAMLGGALFEVLVGGLLGFVGGVAAAGLSACALIAALRAAAPASPWR